MQGLRESSLALQLPLLAAACAFVVGVAVVWLATASGSYLQGNRDAAYGEALARQVAATVSDPLQRGDLLSVRASLQRFIDNSLAEGIRIDDVMGLPIGEAGRTEILSAATAQTTHRARIRVGEDVAGTVFLALEQDDSGDDRLRMLLSLLALVVALSLLVFVLTRYFAQRLATSLRALQSQLLLPESESVQAENEIDLLRIAVEQVPVDMLRGHAGVPPAATDFRDASVLFIHLAGLARYVNTLSESNLHRYTRRLQQMLLAALHCYRGNLRVVRQFGLLVTFAPQHNAGSEALRAASCARLIARVTAELEKRTTLSLDLAMALGHCELGPAEGDDMYPELYLQGGIDELHEACLTLEDYPSVLVAESVLGDTQLAAAASTSSEVEGDSHAARERAFVELITLSPEQETLLDHQAALIAERIKPARRETTA